MSRSFARKKVDSALTRFETSRIDVKASSATASSFAARRCPISGTFRK